MSEQLSAGQIDELDGLDDWRVLLRSLHGSFRTGSLAAGIELATRIGVAADEADHHPDLDITPSRLHVTLTTHDTGGISTLDVELARTISAQASALGIASAPTTVTQLEIAIDAMDIAAVKPFWEAVLDQVGAGPDETRDPRGRAPSFWFQQMDEPRRQRNRVHIDVVVPHDAAADRIAAALAAGGTLVSDDWAPAFWVLADPEGNEACVCTWQGRD